MNFVDLAGETLIGFIGECSGDDLFHAGAPRCARQEAGINAVARNDPDRFGIVHEAIVTM